MKRFIVAMLTVGTLVFAAVPASATPIQARAFQLTVQAHGIHTFDAWSSTSVDRFGKTVCRYAQTLVPISNADAILIATPIARTFHLSLAQGAVTGGAAIGAYCSWVH